MREITLSEIERARAAVDAAGETFQMDEESFRAFYARTSRPLWAYLSRLSGDSSMADDLVQESYYRFLAARLSDLNNAHMKNYLFRIATNLVRDHWRRKKPEVALPPEAAIEEQTVNRIQLRTDLRDAFGRLKPRERELLWLAYVEGSSHKEIAEIIGLRAPSIRLILFRARRKLAGLLRRQGLGGGKSGK